MNVLPLEKQVEIIAALTEGVSIRATERLTDVHRDTIMRLGVRVGEGCQRLHDAMFRNLNVNLLQLDEIWSFIQKKQKRVKQSDPGFYGDNYTWIAFDSINKAVVAYRVGKRTWDDCREFIFDLRDRIVNRCQITSDGYAPYAPTIRAAFGGGLGCDYGQLQKIFEEDERGEEASRRYSPGRVVRIEKEVVFGNPEEAQISTSHVERNNLTLRMQMRRFTRLTNSFSRKPENHKAAVALHVAWHNLCRVHETLRTTPAMALRVTDRIWSIADLVDAALGMSTAPVPPMAPAPSTTARRDQVQLRVIRGGKGR